MKEESSGWNGRGESGGGLYKGLRKGGGHSRPKAAGEATAREMQVNKQTLWTQTN